MIDNLKELFEKHEGEFLKFDRVPIGLRLSTRKDIHAFILLDKLVPGSSRMVSGAEHDEIFLGVGADQLAEVATEEDIIDLIRCGVFISKEFDGLAMFV